MVCMVCIYCTSARIDAGTLIPYRRRHIYGMICTILYYTIADIICYYILLYYIQYTPFVTILTPYITILGILLDVKCYLGLSKPKVDM